MSVRSHLHARPSKRVVALNAVNVAGIELSGFCVDHVVRWEDLTPRIHEVDACIVLGSKWAVKTKES